jgi:hypothetical protein
VLVDITYRPIKWIISFEYVSTGRVKINLHIQNKDEEFSIKHYILTNVGEIERFTKSLFRVTVSDVDSYVTLNNLDDSMILDEIDYPFPPKEQEEGFVLLKVFSNDMRINYQQKGKENDK